MRREATESTTDNSLVDLNEFNTWLEEYRSIRREIEFHMTWQGRALAMASTLVAATLATFATLSVQGHWERLYAPVLLTVSFLLSTVGMLMTNKDEMIIDLASYQDHRISPALARLCGGRQVLGWHEFLREERFGNNRPILVRIAKSMVGPFPHFFIVITAFACLASGASLQYLESYARLSKIENIALCIDAIFFLYFCASASITCRAYRGIRATTLQDAQKSQWGEGCSAASAYCSPRTVEQVIPQHSSEAETDVINGAPNNAKSPSAGRATRGTKNGGRRSKKGG